MPGGFMRGFFTPDVQSLPRGYKPLDITADIISEFRSRYPEFGDSDTYTDDMLTTLLEDADIETGSAWGRYKSRRVKHSLKQRGMFAWAAHYLTVRSQQVQAEPSEDGSSSGSYTSVSGGSAGVSYPVSSESVGDESVSYAVPSMSTADLEKNGDLSSTGYGIEFLRLRTRATSGAWMV